jgi:hypothetical protein
LNTLAAITGKKAGFKSLGDTWADTTTPHGRLMLTVLGGLAEFERDLIRAHRRRPGAGRGARAENGPTAQTNLTSPIRPAVLEFSPGKSLNSKELGGSKRRKSAVVPTKSILKAANVPIIGGHHVPALQSSPEGWQATSLLERCREHADRQGARGAAARAVPG